MATTAGGSATTYLMLMWCNCRRAPNNSPHRIARIRPMTTEDNTGLIFNRQIIMIMLALEVGAMAFESKSVEFHMALIPQRRYRQRYGIIMHV